MAEVKDTRGRNWACVVYPESAPANWMQIFGDAHVPGFISPLHDSDVNPATGEVKKQHYHVMMQRAGKITEDAARAFFESFGGVGCERIGDWAAYARYLCHLDERRGNGKARYNTGEVQMFGGADYFDVIETARDRTALIAEMEVWCEENGCVSLASLHKYARNHRRDWFRILATSMGMNVMGGYVKSLKWERDTGEGMAE